MTYNGSQRGFTMCTDCLSHVDCRMLHKMCKAAVHKDKSMVTIIEMLTLSFSILEHCLVLGMQQIQCLKDKK